MRLGIGSISIVITGNHHHNHRIHPPRTAQHTGVSWKAGEEIFKGSTFPRKVNGSWAPVGCFLQSGEWHRAFEGEPARTITEMWRILSSSSADSVWGSSVGSAPGRLGVPSWWWMWKSNVPFSSHCCLQRTRGMSSVFPEISGKGKKADA